MRVDATDAKRKTDPTVTRGLTLDSRFELEALVGAGGHAQVWRAHDRVRDMLVAVKLLVRTDATWVDADRRLVAEAGVLATLREPGIVGYVAHGVTPGGGPYLVEDWIDGPTLRAYMRSPGLDAREAVALVAAVAEAVGAAHALGVIHRDLKPENILLAGGDLGQPRLVDFGLARHSGLRGLTRTGVVLGTVGYVAPEQARGDRELDVRVDVFTLGCLLYELLTGRPAFAGSGMLAVAAKVQGHEPPPLAETCPEAAVVVPVLAQMMAKDPAHRLSDGRAVAAALRAVTPDAGPRRTARRDDVETETMQEPAVARGTAGGRAIVTGVAVLGDEQDDPEVWRAACAQVPGDTIQMSGAALLVTFGGTDAVTAVDTARTLAERLPGATIAIVTAPADELADRAFALVEAAAIADAFGPGGIRVDPTTAALLPAALVVRRGGDLLVPDR